MKSWTNDNRIIQLQTGGTLNICGLTDHQNLERLRMDLHLKAFRPAKRQKEALVEISKLPDGKVVTAQSADQIVGYVTFHPPDEFERWSQGPRNVLELGAIEVAPVVRANRIAKTLLEVAFEDPRMDDFIVLSTVYYWHWDLDGTGLGIWEYRDLMKRIMEHVGMSVQDTDEEEITAHPANMLMIRYGKNITPEVASEFQKLFFLE